MFYLRVVILYLKGSKTLLNISILYIQTFAFLISMLGINREFK